MPPTAKPKLIPVRSGVPHVFQEAGYVNRLTLPPGSTFEAGEVAGVPCRGGGRLTRFVMPGQTMVFTFGQPGKLASVEFIAATAPPRAAGHPG